MLNTDQPEIRFALEMAEAACRIGKRVQAEMNVEGIAKSDLSPVTVADYAIQAFVGRRLREQFPDHRLVGEESAEALRTDDSAEARRLVCEAVRREIPEADEAAVCDWIDYGAAEAVGSYWTIDPIDGTKGYLRGDQYAAALAFLRDGEVLLGALGCPNLDSACRARTGDGAILVAARGEGAYARPLSGGVLQRIACSKQSDPAQARLLRSVEKGHTNLSDTDLIAQALGVIADPVPMDSQAKYAVLAAGGGEMLLRLLSPKMPDYKEKIWDQAAGAIVLEEAGGRITDLSGRPLDFSQGRTLANNAGVFASNGILHDAGLAAIAQVCGF